VAFGKTYSEWAAAWQEWSLSIPASKHPLFNNGDCSTGQKGIDGKMGPVFFLGGGYAGPSGAVKRTCTVPAGKALFFPIVNVEDTVLEEGCVKKTRERHAVREMEVDPSKSLCRRRLQTAMSCFGQKPRW